VKLTKTIFAIILIEIACSLPLLLGLTSCGNETAGLTSISGPSELANANTTPGMAHLSRVEGYNSIDELIKDSPVIVVGLVASKNNEFTYGSEMTFALTEFKVETAVRGEIPDTVNILQTYAYEDPYLVKGDRMILFIKHYTGPLTQNAYRLMGLFQGQYKIDGNEVIKDSQNIIADDEIKQTLGNIETLKSRANSLGYAPSITPISSTESK
jgi:hypothetical protein